MNVLKVGDIAPDFSCKNQYGELINLSDMKGKKIVVFFYPKANTPGCTAEACNLNDNYSRFKSMVMKLLVFRQIMKNSRKISVINLILVTVYYVMRIKKLSMTMGYGVRKKCTVRNIWA